MTNILSDEKKQQVIALGRLGWTLRRIEVATAVITPARAGACAAVAVLLAGIQTGSLPLVPVATPELREFPLVQTTAATARTRPARSDCHARICSD